MKTSKKLFYVACMALLLASCEKTYNDKLFWPGEISQEYGSYIKPYTLDLTYSGEKLAGKTVNFKTEDSETGTLTLNDVIPGENTTPINDVQLNESGEKDAYTFNGTSVTKAGAEVKYSGRITPKAMQLSLEVTMAHYGSVANTYVFPPYSHTYEGSTVRNSGASYVRMTATEGSGGAFLVPFIQAIATNLLDALLPHILSDITLEKNGITTAQYTTSPINMDEIMDIVNSEMSDADFQSIINNRTYTLSPKGLIFWNQINNTNLVMQLNLPQILSLITQNSEQNIDSQLIAGVSEALLKSDPIRLKAALSTVNQILNNKIISYILQVDDTTFTTIFSWLKSGIPVEMNQENGHTYLYVNKNTIIPIFSAIAPIITENLGMDISGLLGMIDTMDIGLDLTTQK